MNTSDPISIFHSYVHKDETLRTELYNHLRSLRGIVQWHYGDIKAGDNLSDQVNIHLNKAHIILLLISHDFLASDDHQLEMEKALKRHESGEAQVIPIVLRPAHWEHTPLVKLKVLPTDKVPVTAYDNKDQVFYNIVAEISSVVERLRQVKLPGPNISEFRRCQKKVSELKEVHHMLHEIEWGLGGLLILLRGGREEINPRLYDFNGIANIWTNLLISKIDDLVDFAQMEMEVLEDERFSRGSDGVERPVWATDLFDLRQSFKVKINERDINGIEDECAKLLQMCGTYLCNIHKRLRNAIRDLDRSSMLIRGDRT